MRNQRARRLKAKVDLGLGVIPIILVSPARMRELAECDADDVTPNGLWDDEHEVIYIGQWLPWKEKRKVFWHELRHAVADLEYWGED